MGPQGAGEALRLRSPAPRTEYKTPLIDPQNRGVLYSARGAGDRNYKVVRTVRANFLVCVGGMGEVEVGLEQKDSLCFAFFEGYVQPHRLFLFPAVVLENTLQKKP